VRDWRVSVTDKIVDSVCAVTGRVQHPADDPFWTQDALVDQAIEHLLDLWPETDKYGFRSILRGSSFLN